jgi:ABC-2 type transport system ATP-binding protein
MSQRFSLYEPLTVDQNIRFFGGVYGLSGSVLEERRAFVLEMAGLEGRERALARELSGGWRQRLALGCAILHEPSVLFLDEPTGGVDPLSRRQFWRLIDTLSSAGVTVLVTTHYLDEAEALADRIAIMHKGAVVRAGTLREIVDGHPARIAFDHPGLSLPKLPGARIDARARVTVTTHDLQSHLSEVLAWAREHGVRLGGLEARAASLESVFLDIAGDSADATSANPELIGASR